MNKRQQEIYNRYVNSRLHTLRDCYNSWSNAKEIAYNKCAYECAQKNGYSFRIISFNSTMFSIGYLYIKGIQTIFHYETNYTCKEWRIS